MGGIVEQGRGSIRKGGIESVQGKPVFEIFNIRGWGV